MQTTTQDIVSTLRTRQSLLSTREVASVLGFVCVDTVQRMASAGKLRYTKIGKRLKFDTIHVADFIESRKVSASL
jgi:excisionase family DNA binding protein